MNIPKNGRVVIIDDEDEKEGFPLVRALTKNKIATIYFTGNIEELPDNPLKGIRIVFLDIVLGTDGQPAKTQIATAAKIFKSIIDRNNGPYLLIAWTNHEEHIEGIKAALNDMPPSCFLNLEKSKCKNTDGSFNINKIEKKIKKELKKVTAFHLFALWENLVHQAAGEIVNDFSSLYQTDAQWNEKISSVLFQLAKAYVGKKTEDMKNDEIVINALLSFNGAFIDTLESLIRNYKAIAKNLTKNNITDGIIGKINKKLLLFIDNKTRNPEPGNVYEIGNRIGTKFDLKELFEGDIATYTEKNDLESKARYFFLEVSPSCDFAQNNWRVHRCLSGIMWPHAHVKKLKKSEFTYKSPLIEIDNGLYYLVFNLRYLTSLPIGKLNKKKALFRVRHDLLVDIQSHLARHINRPGIISL